MIVDGGEWMDGYIIGVLVTTALRALIDFIFV